MNRQSALFLLMLAAIPASAAEKTLDRTFAVSPGGSLVVDAESASIRVSGDNTRQVTVRMIARGTDEDLARLSFDASQKGDAVTVTLRRTEKKGLFNWGSGNLESEIQVSVPANFRISATSSGGSVELRDTTGDATLRTSGGSIAARNISGDLMARTSGGGITADSIRGDVDAATSGGDLRLLGIDGRIRGRTTGGSVRCSLVGANRGISATTSGGSIHLTLPRGTRADVEASTSGGDVSSDLPIAVSRKTETYLAGSLNDGGERIEARTSGGSIRLRAAD
jgi:DUF4097 and DUF4098 domain-containing protein YvlB